jgi:AraC-like DNA-binding protein
MNLLAHLPTPTCLPDRHAAFGIAHGVNHHPERTLDHWVLGLPLRGRVALRIGADAAPVSVGADSYYLLPPGIRHHGAGFDDADIAYLHFRTVKGHERFRLALIGRRPHQVDYAGVFAFLADAAASGTLAADHLDRQLIVILDQLACTAQQPPALAALTQVAEALLTILRTRYAERLDRATLVRLTGYSSGYLDRCFRRTFGQSIHHRLIRIRIAAARAQLLHGRSIAATAAACGFNDERHFRKSFTSLTGTPPGRFAAEVSGELARVTAATAKELRRPPLPADQHPVMVMHLRSQA